MLAYCVYCIHSIYVFHERGSHSLCGNLLPFSSVRFRTFYTAWKPFLIMLVQLLLLCTRYDILYMSVLRTPLLLKALSNEMEFYFLFTRQNNNPPPEFSLIYFLLTNTQESFSTSAYSQSLSRQLPLKFRFSRNSGTKRLSVWTLSSRLAFRYLNFSSFVLLTRIFVSFKRFFLFLEISNARESLGNFKQ